MWRSGPCAIHFSVRDGSSVQGAVLLRYILEGLDDLGHKLLTLRRFAGLSRLGRMPVALFPRERRASRWIAMLRVLDALDDGASQRRIAEGLFDGRGEPLDWRGSSDYLRLRVQRLVRTAVRLCNDEYVVLLSARSPL